MVIEGDSAYVHLNDYIEWNSPGVIPRVFPLMFGHTVTLTLLETIVEVGSALRGTRASLIASDEELG